jgi:hypothetical protein
VSVCQRVSERDTSPLHSNDRAGGAGGFRYLNLSESINLYTTLSGLPNMPFASQCGWTYDDFATRNHHLRSMSLVGPSLHSRQPNFSVAFEAKRT